MFSFIKGEAQLTLQNSGWGTCALPFNTGFVTIGGFGNGAHGKVDRCSNLNCEFCFRILALSSHSVVRPSVLKRHISIYACIYTDFEH